MEKFINRINGLLKDYMEDDEIDYNQEITKMFSGDNSNNDYYSSDEELALHIFHKFNIDRETLESMPAFEENLKSLFGREKEK